MEMKNDRRGLHTASKRFTALIQKIPTSLSRLQWKTPSQPVLSLHKLRLEGVLAVKNLFFFNLYFCNVYFVMKSLRHFYVIILKYFVHVVGK